MSQILEQLEVYESTGMWEWGEEAPEFILSLLEAKDSELRQRAASLAGQIVDDELGRKLLWLVAFDRVPEVAAAAAAISLGPALEECSDEYDEDGCLDPINELYDLDLPLSSAVYQEVLAGLKTNFADAGRPALVRQKCAEAAVRAQAEWVREAVPVMLADQDVTWQATAIFCMGYMRGFEEQILAAFESEEEMVVKREAIIAAGNQELKQLGKQILALAASEETSKTIRLAALQALGTLSPAGATDLLEDLRDHADEDIAQLAAYSLEDHGLFGDLDDDEDLFF